MKRFCFALDLHDDPAMIAEYDNWHTRVAAEIKETITSTGIVAMDIYRVGNRMFMIVDAHDDFSLEEKSKKDADNPVVQEWEKLMWKFQKPLPFAKDGEKWMLMKQIFGL